MRKFTLFLFAITFVLLNSNNNLKLNAEIKTDPTKNGLISISDEEYQSIIDDMKATDDIGFDNIFTPIDDYNLPSYNSNHSYKATETTSFPSTFDLRNYNLITPVKRQLTYGTCWAFSALASIETNLIKRYNQPQTLDLSEWHLAYFTYTGNTSFTPANTTNIFYEGGSNNYATTILSKWIGTVFEKTVPYNSGTTFDESLRFNADFHMQDAYNIRPWIEDPYSYSVDEIKDLLFQKNALSISYYSNENYYNSQTASHFCNEDIKPDHGSTIIGWDDNYPKENFLSNMQPQNNGAWLVKNSWGTSWGKEGYFWLSYEDKTLKSMSAFFAEPKNNYLNNYSYDEFGYYTTISADRNQTKTTSYMSNIYTAKENEYVSAVSFFTFEPNTSYEILIYNKLTNKAVPSSGTASEKTIGTEKYSGYHTIKLNTPIPISTGESFSTVVKITSPTTTFCIPVEAYMVIELDGQMYANIDYKKYNDNSSSGQSYISSDGLRWTDINKSSYTYKSTSHYNLSTSNISIKNVYLGNVCLKTFTSKEITENISGDINKDGSVSYIDFILLKSFLIMSDSLELDLNVADLNYDANIDVFDMILLKKIILQSN